MSWRIDPKTGDYKLTQGAPVDDLSLIYPAYYRLKVKRTQWLYAPNVNYGSDFWTVKKRFDANDVNQMTNIAERAVQPIINDGRASTADATFKAPLGRNDIQLALDLVDAQGNTQTLSLPVVGG